VPDVVDLDEPDVVVVADAPEGPAKLRGSIGRPVRVVNTSPVSGQAEPMSMR
jgi:hypothetical protein